MNVHERDSHRTAAFLDIPGARSTFHMQAVDLSSCCGRKCVLLSDGVIDGTGRKDDTAVIDVYHHWRLLEGFVDSLRRPFNFSQ